MIGILRPALLLGALASQPAGASGSYVFRPVRAAAHDSIRYELGKAIFSGKASLPRETRMTGVEREAQERRLANWQKQLPAKVRPTGELTALAGRMNADHMAALEYYLKVRYKVR